MVKKCAIQGCKSESYAGCGVSFFKLPGEESGRKKWLDVIPSHSNIKNYSLICSLHFRPQDIIKHSSVSKLKSDAVPTIFPKIVPPEKKIAILSNMIVQAAPVTSKAEVSIEKPANISVTPEHKFEINQPTRHRPSTSKDPPTKKIRYECEVIEGSKREVKVLKQRVKRRDLRIDSLKSLLNVIKKKTHDPEEIESVIKMNFVHIHDQFNYAINNKKVRYSEELKCFALTLHFYSPKAYLFLRKHVCLPHPATLRRLLATRDCSVGFIQEVSMFLKETAAKDASLKNVALLFDSMAIRTELRYDKKNR